MEAPYPLNALGRYTGGEWGPFFLDNSGNHRDPNGLLLMPFDEIQLMSAEEIGDWLRSRKEIPVTMGMLK